jgi:hypothetical protein
MKNADRLLHRCPKCHAKPGESCRQYTGELLRIPHKVRGPGKEEAALVAAEERRVERQRAKYGPLFQEIAKQEVQPRQLDELAWERRFAAARGAECATLIDPANSGLEWVRLRWLQHCLPRIVGEEMGRAIWEYAERVYGHEQYIASFICECLTQARRRVIRHELRFDSARINPNNSDGRYLVDALVWEPREPVMSGEEFDRRFPRLDHKWGVPVDDEPDDGGLYERLLAMLGAAA